MKLPLCDFDWKNDSEINGLLLNHFGSAVSELLYYNVAVFRKCVWGAIFL